MYRAFVVLAALLAAAVPMTSAGAADCAVPCGYIYPLILLQFPDYDGVNPVAPDDGKRVLPGTLTYQWDVTNEGYAVQDPAQDVVVTFEYPKKPAWLDARIEPSEVPIQLLPIHLDPDENDPAGGSTYYRYSVPVTLTIEAKAEAPADAVYSKVLIFAKSTESGLYKPAYGIKEVRVATGYTEDEVLAATSSSETQTPGFGLAALGAAAGIALVAARSRKAIR